MTAHWPGLNSTMVSDGAHNPLVTLEMGEMTLALQGHEDTET